MSDADDSGPHVPDSACDEQQELAADGTAREAEASLDMAAEAAAMPPATGSSDSPSPAASSGAQAQVLRVFQTMSEAEQQECLRALQKHAADALPI